MMTSKSQTIINRLGMLLVAFFSIFVFSIKPVKVKAATQVQTSPRILLVYDSYNVRENRQTDVETLSRILMSMGQQVTETSTENYHAGQLTKGNYQAVITMINWPEMNFTNDAFTRDRQNFKGKKLHIGLNLTAAEQQAFPGQWVTLNEQAFTLQGEHDYYDEQLNFQKSIQLLKQTSGAEQQVAQLISTSGNHEKFPYGVINGKNAYIPLFDDKGAPLLASIQLIAKWLGIKGSYNPYIAVQGFTPLSPFGVTKKFVKQLNQISNNVIITTTSTTQNTDTKTFKNYLKFLKTMTKDDHAVLYLNVPALNTADSSNDDTLENMLTQEISTFIENKIFPLGISAPSYWNFDKYYQMNALDFGDAVMLYGQTQNQYFHTKTKTSQVFPTNFFALPNSALKNVNWKINGKYTEFTFPMPTTIDYQFPKTEKQVDKMFKEILHDPFPPTDKYLYRFNTGISTQTQNLHGANGVITLNGVPVNNINFEAIENRDNANAKADNTQSSAVTTKNIVDNINDILTVIIVSALIILTIMLFKGRRLYLRMFKSRLKKQKKGNEK